MFKITSFFFSFLLLFWIPSLYGQSNSTTLTLDHFKESVSISGPKISPNGKDVLFTTRAQAYEQNKSITSVWVLNLKTKAKKTISAKGWGFNWSKDGKALTYLSNDDQDKAQVFKVPLKSDDPEQLTKCPTGINNYAFSPNGQLIAYTTNETPVEKTGIEQHKIAFEVGYDAYLSEGVGNLAQLWVCSAEGKDLQRLSRDELGQNLYADQIAWSPDSKKLVYISQPSAYSADFSQGTLQLVDIATNKITPLVGPATLFYPAFSKNGASVIYNNSVVEDEIWVNPSNMFSVDLKGNKKGALIKADRDFHEPIAFFEDGSFVAGAADGTKHKLWRTYPDGTTKKIDTKNIFPSPENFDVTGSNEIVFVGGTATEPAELYYQKEQDALPIKLTSFNKKLAQIKYGKVETISYQNGGFQQEGVLYYPINYSKNKKYPMVVYLQNKFSASENYFDFGHVMAAKDWIVFAPNYRGCYTNGKAYQNAVLGDTGEGPSKDVLAGIAAVEQLGMVDKDKIAIGGHGFGGLLTSWLSAHYSRWSSAVTVNPIMDWVDMYSLSHLNHFYPLPINASPWVDNNLEIYRRQSPLTYASQIKTPTLILTTTKNPYFPNIGAYKLFHCLKDNKVESKYVAFKMHGYWPSDPINRIDFFQQWITWMEAHF